MPKRRKRYRWNPQKRKKILTGLGIILILLLVPHLLGASLPTESRSTGYFDLQLHEVNFRTREDLVRRHQLAGIDAPATVPLPDWTRSVGPLIYIFNAHDHEVIGAQSADTYWIGEMTIMEVSRYMADLFEDRGIPTLVEERLPNELIAKRGWRWDSHYRASRVFLEEAIEAHPTLQFFFDMHRDSISDNRIRTTINGEPYATMIFILSYGHPNYAENLDVLEHLIERLEARYPGIMRRDYLSDTITPIQFRFGSGDTPHFNQDLSENLILFEIGGPTSAVEEVLNTVRAVVEVLYDFIVE